MGTDRISPSSSMLDLVRSLGVSRGGRAGEKGKSSSTAAESRGALAHDRAVLRQRLTDLLAKVDPDDEAALLRIRRPLLQEIILWEFGGDFRQHSEFAGMLETIDRTLDADPLARERLANLVRYLKKQPSP